MESKQFPFDLRAENLFLGSLIERGYLISKYAEKIPKSSIFWNDNNRIIYEIILDLFKNKIEIDRVLIYDKIKQMKLCEKISINYLMSLESGINTDEYLLILLDKFYKREIIKGCRVAIKRCFDDGDNIIDVTMDLLECVNDVRIDFNTGEEKGEALTGYLEKLRSGDIKEIPTGFDKLDSIIGGFEYGHYVVLGAKPKTGKTTFLINLLYNQSYLMDLPVRFYSLEMKREDILLQLLARHLQVDKEKIKQDKLKINERLMRDDFINELNKLELEIIDNVFNLNTMVNQIINCKEKIIYIDYNEYIEDDSKKNTYELLLHISRTLSKVANKHNKVIIMLQQIKTDGEIKDPISDNLYMKVGIKEASKILILYKDETGDRLLKVTENRFGNVGKVRFDFNGKLSTFLER